MLKAKQTNGKFELRIRQSEIIYEYIFKRTDEFACENKINYTRSFGHKIRNISQIRNGQAYLF